MPRLSDWYDYRIVNVNVNVIAAGVAALGFTVGVLHLMDRTGALGAVTNLVRGREFSLPGLPFRFMGEKMVIGGLTFAIDLIADVLVYYALHWVANHMPRPRQVPRTRAYADMSFMRDATLVQFERALLSPVLYIAALGLQQRLLHTGWSVEASTAIGFTVGIAMTRVLHTLWMLRAERRAGRYSAADIVGPDRVRPSPPGRAAP
jgi:hypothetical protein